MIINEENKREDDDSLDLFLYFLSFQSPAYLQSHSPSFHGKTEIACGGMILVALWQLAWLLLSLASFSWPLPPSHTKYKQTLKTEPVDTREHTHTHTHSVSE